MADFVYSSPSDTHARITAALDAAEKGARSRLLPREQLGALVEAVASRPWGYAHGNGGAVPNSYRYTAETTHFICAWYTWRGKKHISVSASRAYAKKEAYGASGHLSLDDANAKGKAYAAVFPDRAHRYRQLRFQRFIRHLPPLPAGVGDIMAVRPDSGGIVTVMTARRGLLVGTPAGWITAPKNAEASRPAWNILVDLGFPVPRRKAARIWTDELTAYAAMRVLGGE